MTNGNASNERMAEIERTMARIAERHEALAQTVEIFGHGMEDLRSHMTNLTVTMDRLANIVIRHEERLDALDGGDE